MQQQLLLAWALLAAAGVASLVVSVSAEEHVHHHHHHARKLYIRDLVDPSQKCRNTFNGPVNITDDKGMLCSRSDLDTQTGCCRGGTQHDCSKCMPYDQCCSEYEACVSCCLHPSNKADKEAKERLKAEKHQSAGKWGDAFDFCRGACRTTGKSTAHENAYIGPRHHCFSQHGKPLMTGPMPEGVFDKALLAIGGSNENCDVVCNKWGAQGCSVELLRQLNNCDRLREWAACEAGCDASGAVTGPLYVDPNAPKAERPAMCFVHPNPEALTCGASADHHHRLCGCNKKQ